MHSHDPEFLLTEGGPAYKLEVRFGLVKRGSAHQPRRAFLSAVVTWLPLLILSVLQHNAIGDHVQLPFVRDFAVHARFLLAVPLLLLSEGLLGPRLSRTAYNFVDSDLVPEADWGRFDEAIRRGLDWRDSWRAELALYLLSFGVTVAAFFSTSIPMSTWYALRTQAGLELTWAGWWLILFCIPLLQFLALRWLWRLFLWAQFLWRMRALSLNVMPTHPDQAGGLAFVGESERFFGVVLFAYSMVVSGVLANDVVYVGVPLKNFAAAIAVYTAMGVTVVIAPLLTFAPLLWSLKRSGKYAYSTLALSYTKKFHEKWIVRLPISETLLGTSDIQSLADLGNSFEFVERIRVLPMGPRTPIHLALACIIPMAPLLLTVMPLDQVLKMVLKMIV